MKRRFGLRTGLVAMILLAAGFVALPHLIGKHAPRLSYETARVERGSMRVTVSATGTLSALETVEVGTQVSGTISRIYADYNDRVSKGQILAKIDDTLLAAEAQEAVATHAKAQAQYAQKRNEYERAQKLHKAGVISSSTLEEQEAAHLSAGAEVASTQARAARAKTNLRYTVICAPVGGVIISRNADEGQTVAASFATPTLFTIANDLAHMQLLVDVDEADVGLVRPGQGVSFDVDPYPDTSFRGSVEEIRLLPKVNQNVVTYTVVVGADNAALKLLPGMNATVEIVVAEKTDVLKVPAAATGFTPSSQPGATSGKEGTSSTPSGVWVVQGDQLRRVALSKGLSDGVYLEIMSEGLTEGTVVLTGETTAEPQESTKTSLLPSPGRRR